MWFFFGIFRHQKSLDLLLDFFLISFRIITNKCFRAIEVYLIKLYLPQQLLRLIYCEYLLRLAVFSKLSSSFSHLSVLSSSFSLLSLLSSSNRTLQRKIHHGKLNLEKACKIWTGTLSMHSPRLWTWIRFNTHHQRLEKWILRSGCK